MESCSGQCAYDILRKAQHDILRKAQHFLSFFWARQAPINFFVQQFSLRPNYLVLDGTRRPLLRIGGMRVQPVPLSKRLHTLNSSLLPSFVPPIVLASRWATSPFLLCFFFWWVRWGWSLLCFWRWRNKGRLQRWCLHWLFHKSCGYCGLCISWRTPRWWL